MSSRCPDLAPGWDPLASPVLPRDSSAKILLSSPQPRSLPASAEGKGMGGQDWLSLLPQAGGQGWGCSVGMPWPLLTLVG